MYYEQKDVVRFLKKITKKPNGCWEWISVKNKDQYGQFYLKYFNRAIPAHRASFLMFNGNIPFQAIVCHHCDNPPCVNPEHLFLGSHKDNMMDKVKKGRHVSLSGIKSSRSKLTETQVKEILESNYSNRKLSIQYNVSSTCIDNIKSGRTWHHISHKKPNLIFLDKIIKYDHNKGKKLGPASATRKQNISTVLKNKSQTERISCVYCRKDFYAPFFYRHKKCLIK